MRIHPTAVVDKKARIHESAEIGPYTIIGRNVSIAKNVIIGSHAVIDGFTTIGKGCRIFSGAVIGSPSQDLKSKNERSFVRIGKQTTIREFVTINAATGEEKETVIGDDCFLMAYAHVAHNCRLGNEVVMANCATLAGHVEIEDKAIIGGLAAIHQFCRVGRLSLIGGCAKVVQDVSPFTIADGHPAVTRSLNSVGLRRNGFSEQQRRELKQAFKIIFKSGQATSRALEKVTREVKSNAEVKHLVDFIKKSERGIC